MNLNSVAPSFGPAAALAQTPRKNVTHVGAGGSAQSGWMDGWEAETENSRGI